MTGRPKPPAPDMSELAARFNTPATPVTPASDTSVTHEEQGLRVPKSRQTKPPKKTTRPAPAGMVRRSLYTHADVIDELIAAADRIVDRTQGGVTKADAIAGLIRAGVVHEDQVLHELLDQLRSRYS